MNEEFEKEFNKLSEKDKREVNNLIRFMQEKKYHDKQYEELLNQYIEMARDFDKLQSNWNSLREWLIKEIINTKQKWGNKLTDKGYLDIAMTVKSYEIILNKMNELEGVDNEGKIT